MQTNAPGYENTSITIKGELWQIVEATPPNVMYGSLRGSGLKPEQLVRKVAIKNNDPNPIKLSPPVSSSPVFSAELRDLADAPPPDLASTTTQGAVAASGSSSATPKPPPGKSFELIITAKQPLPMGSSSGSITMNTGLVEMPVVNVPVSVYVTADVEATPAQVIIPLSIPKPMQRIVYVRNWAEKPMKLTDHSLTNSSIKSTLTEPQAGVAWRITLDFPADTKLPPGGDKLTIKTDNEKYATLVVPIMQAGSPSMNANQAAQARQKKTAPGAAGQPVSAHGGRLKAANPGANANPPTQSKEAPSDGHNHSEHDGHNHGPAQSPTPQQPPAPAGGTKP